MIETTSSDKAKPDLDVEIETKTARECEVNEGADETKIDVENPMLRSKNPMYFSDDAWLNSIDETTSLEEIIRKSDQMIGLSINLNKPYSKDIQLEVHKEQLVRYLQKKIDKLKQRIRLAQHKYASYKYYNNGVNIGIILISTTMVLLESVKHEIGESNLALYPTWESIFSLMPVFLSSSITCAASIVKFKKFQEKMEGISKTCEKCAFAIARIQKCQEDIIFLKTNEDFDVVKERYHQDIYDYYNSCDQEIQLYLKSDDYGKYLKFLNDMDINVLILEKDKIKRERNIESEFDSYMTELEEKKKSKIRFRKNDKVKSFCTIC